MWFKQKLTPGTAIMKSSRFIALLLSVACLAASFLVFRSGTSTVVAWAFGPPTGDSPSPACQGIVTDKLPPDVDVAGSTQSKEVAPPGEHIAAMSMRTLAIHVAGLKDQSSTLHVAVFDSAEGFPDPGHSRTTIRIPVATGMVVFSLLVPDMSTHGIAVFQDLNGDGKLTKNVLGLPMEPYGFSNNARSKFGPPSFREAAFVVKEEASSMEIRVR